MIKLMRLLFESRRENPNFLRWFGHSQVVDSEGNPMVVFHGTKSPPNKFSKKRTGFGSTVLGSYEIERHGIFAAEDPQLAAEFASQGDDSIGSSIMPLFMKIEAPLDTTKVSYSDGLFNSVEEEANKMGLDGFSTARILGDRWGRGKIWLCFDSDEHNNPEDWIKLFENLGYDGLKIYEPSESSNRTETWVAFHPEQVKSASGNSGQYNDDDHDITKESVESDEEEPIDRDKLFWNESYLDDVAETFGFKDNFNEIFWNYPKPLFHCTTEENYEEIRKTGLHRKSDTRGINNRSVGSAIFTTSEEEEISHISDSYGPVVIQIDTKQMKLDGYMPDVSREPEVEVADKLSFVLNKMGEESEMHQHISSSDGISEYTIIIYGQIPVKYLSSNNQ